MDQINPWWLYALAFFTLVGGFVGHLNGDATLGLLAGALLFFVVSLVNESIN